MNSKITLSLEQEEKSQDTTLPTTPLSIGQDGMNCFILPMVPLGPVHMVTMM